jgi:hypothetical protein
MRHRSTNAPGQGHGAPPSQTTKFTTKNQATGGLQLESRALSPLADKLPALQHYKPT